LPPKEVQAHCVSCNAVSATHTYTHRSTATCKPTTKCQPLPPKDLQAHNALPATLLMQHTHTHTHTHIYTHTGSPLPASLRPSVTPRPPSPATLLMQHTHKHTHTHNRRKFTATCKPTTKCHPSPPQPCHTVDAISTHTHTHIHTHTTDAGPPLPASLRPSVTPRPPRPTGMHPHARPGPPCLPCLPA